MSSAVGTAQHADRPGGAGWIPVSEALARGQSQAPWPPRGAPDAIEPEAWPTIAPSFAMQPGSKVFTIGSCFARNIEMHLAGSGFDIPMLSATVPHVLMRKHGNQVLNLYTPPNIYQQISWAHDVLHRDDTLRASDVDRFIYRLPDGRIIDLGLAGAHPVNDQQFFERRQTIYQIFRQAFFSPYAVMTLGLIECWYHANLGIFMGNYYPKYFREDMEVVFFKVMDFDECYRYTAASVDLLATGKLKNLLITTSPVPLTRTFSGQDVVIANMYSKSVLRAVAGQLANERPQIDYFPSFESVMLTRQPYVWEDDLKHVSDGFVGRIVSRVSAAYTAGEQKVQCDDELLLFTDLVCQGDAASARTVLERVAARAKDTQDGDFHGCAACVYLADGNLSQGIAHLDKHLATESRDPILLVNLDVLSILEKLEQTVPLDRCWRELLRRCRARPGLFPPVLKYAEARDQMEKARWLARHAVEVSPTELRFQLFLARLEAKAGNTDAALAAARAAHAISPRNVDALSQLAALLTKSGQYEEAVAIASKAMAIEPDNAKAYLRLSEAYQKNGQLDQAIAVLEAGRKRAPGDSHIADRLRRLAARANPLLSPPIASPRGTPPAA